MKASVSRRRKEFKVEVKAAKKHLNACIKNEVVITKEGLDVVRRKKLFEAGKDIDYHSFVDAQAAQLALDEANEQCETAKKEIR